MKVRYINGDITISRCITFSFFERSVRQKAPQVPWVKIFFIISLLENCTISFMKLLGQLKSRKSEVMALSFLLANQRRSILNESPCFKLSCNDSKPLIILFELNAGNLT